MFETDCVPTLLSFAMLGYKHGIMSEELFFSLDQVRKHYPVDGGLLATDTSYVRAVDGVSLQVRKGETLGLVGESGCGKSTLARLLLKLEQPTSGAIEVEGTNVWDAPQEFIKGFPKKVQMVFQDPFSSLNPRRSIGATIGEPLKIHGVPKEERNRRVLELLEQVGLRPELAKRYPHEFSGGQRQRVAIARALALNPECVVCDEPVSALDVSIQAQVVNLLKKLQDEYDLTYVFISHDLAIVGHVSDRVAVMYLGKIVELANVDDLFSNALHPYTQALLQAVPVPDPESDSLKLVVKGDPPSPINPPSGCPFHPRCQQAMDRCSVDVPQWKEISTGHFTACHLHT